jgi:hypothetical protein
MSPPLHVCPVCKRTFKTLGRGLRHIRMDHPEYNERIWQEARQRASARHSDSIPKDQDHDDDCLPDSTPSINSPSPMITQAPKEISRRQSSYVTAPSPLRQSQNSPLPLRQSGAPPSRNDTLVLDKIEVRSKGMSGISNYLVRAVTQSTAHKFEIYALTVDPWPSCDITTAVIAQKWEDSELEIGVQADCTLGAEKVVCLLPLPGFYLPDFEFDLLTVCGR